MTTTKLHYALKDYTTLVKLAVLSWDARPFPDSDANLVSNGVSIWHRSTLKWYTLI